MKNILIIHPHDKSTSALNRIKYFLLRKFEGQVHHFNIHPNDYSHRKCLERIISHSEKGFIIFLGHGLSNTLLGSVGDFYDNKSFASEISVMEHPEKYYCNDCFIDKDNVKVFSGKKVFCLSCNSNDKIADLAVSEGARVFFGFGNIPSSVSEFENDGLKNPGNDIVRLLKTEVNFIIKTSLEFAIINNYNFYQLRDIIQFKANQRITYHLRDNKKLRERYNLSDYLYRFKSEIKIKGDGSLKLIE